MLTERTKKKDESIPAQYSAGVLVVVFNYTGDRFNFGMSVEKAKALGLKVTGLLVRAYLCPLYCQGWGARARKNINRCRPDIKYLVGYLSRYPTSGPT